MRSFQYLLVVKIIYFLLISLGNTHLLWGWIYIFKFWDYIRIKILRWTKPHNYSDTKNDIKCKAFNNYIICITFLLFQSLSFLCKIWIIYAAHSVLLCSISRSKMKQVMNLHFLLKNKRKKNKSRRNILRWV